MKTITMLKPALEEQSYGSAFDPVLNGVADGLSRLFPPIDNVRHCEQDTTTRAQKTRGQDARICAKESVGSHPRT